MSKPPSFTLRTPFSSNQRFSSSRLPLSFTSDFFEADRLLIGTTFRDCTAPLFRMAMVRYLSGNFVRTALTLTRTETARPLLPQRLAALAPSSHRLAADEQFHRRKLWGEVARVTIDSYLQGERERLPSADAVADSRNRPTQRQPGT